MLRACCMNHRPLLFHHTSSMFRLRNAASHVRLRAGDMTAQTGIVLTDCVPPGRVFGQNLFLWTPAPPPSSSSCPACPLWTYAAGAVGGKQVSPWMTLLLLTGQSYTLTAIVSVFVTAEGICPEASSGLQWVTSPCPPNPQPPTTTTTTQPTPLLFPLHERQTGTAENSSMEVKMEGGHCRQREGRG